MANLNVKIVKKLGVTNEDISYFIEYLKSKDIDIVEDVRNSDLIVSFGGDGTVLSLVPELLIKNVPVFSVNYGHLGFITKFSRENIIFAFDKYLNNEYTIDFRQFLRVDFKDKTYFALNEITVAKYYIHSSLINVDLYQEDTFINHYRADGVIVSTATGSTAYSLSTGGPIIQPGIHVMCVTPLAPQRLTSRALLVDGNKELKLTASGRNDYVGLEIDGKEHFKIYKDDEVKVRLCEIGISLICIDGFEYFDVLRNKLNWS